MIRQLQSAASDEGSSVASVLRRAKIASVRLKQEETSAWITDELNGYNCRFDELPIYRQAHGSLYAFNPFRGLVPYIIKDSRISEALTRTPIMQGVGALEQTLGRLSDDTLEYSLPPQQKELLIKGMSVPMEPHLLISPTILTSILDRVRGLVLDWALELESRGIMGHDEEFNEKEIRATPPITQKIYAQNISNLGSVSNGGVVSSSQVAIKSENLTGSQIAELSSSISALLPLLPETEREQIQRELVILVSEGSASKKEGALRRIQSISDNVTGNVAAQGIIAMLQAIF